MPGTSTSRGVVYQGPGKVEMESIDFLRLVNPKGKHAEHGVLIKIVAANLCGSDHHMVRSRTTAPVGLALGHEITGDVIQVGRDVEFLGPAVLVLGLDAQRPRRPPHHRRFAPRHPSHSAARSRAGSVAPGDRGTQGVDRSRTHERQFHAD